MFIKKLSANNENVESNYSYENNNDGNYNVFAQFVPGHVADVITSRDHYLYKSLGNNDLYLNAIKASSHYGDETSSKIYNNMGGDIYVPLLRGIVDVPIRGDQVLLCEFGDIKYYIGPLNTINSPNFNPDLLLDLDQSDINSDDRRKLNISPGFIWHPPYSQNVNRLEKVANADLDFSGKDDEFVANNPVGDIILEGRFGNSIRLGSRADYPHIFISNGRFGGGSVESLNDETLISITSAGALAVVFNPMTALTNDNNIFLSSSPSTNG